MKEKTCEEMILDVNLNVQELCIVADLHVLAPVGLDVILGNA